MIEWLDNHGDIFLSKNTTIGKSASKAKALQKNHEHFASVAQVRNETHLQADKHTQMGGCKGGGIAIIMTNLS